jgi:small subunit ribosomal protein S2
LASELVKELLDSGIHFGHRVSRWNPKMKPYIFGKRNMIHIIDIKETLKGILRSKKFLSKLVSEGGDILIVGTKRQARNAVETHARRCNMHYVSERWLGGTLTNFRTIRSRLQRLEELERLEETGELANYSKKMISTLTREKKKMKRNLEGIRKMDKLPKAMIVIDPGFEHIAVKEAKKLEIPTVCLIDTEGDPDWADIPIPGNDDSMRGIEIVIRELADAILEGLQVRPEEQPVTEQHAMAEGPEGEGERHRRPRRRPPQRHTPSAQPAPVPVPAAPAAEPAPSEPELPKATEQPVEQSQGGLSPEGAPSA